MIYNRIFKLPNEQFFITASMLPIRHEATEEVQLLGSSVIATDREGLDVSTSVLDQSTIAVVNHPNRDDATNTCLSIRCRAGTIEKSPYNLTFTLATTLGNILQVKADLVIQSFS